MRVLPEKAPKHPLPVEFSLHKKNSTHPLAIILKWTKHLFPLPYQKQKRDSRTIAFRSGEELPSFHPDCDPCRKQSLAFCSRLATVLLSQFEQLHFRAPNARADWIYPSLVRVRASPSVTRRECFFVDKRLAAVMPNFEGQGSPCSKTSNVIKSFSDCTDASNRSEAK